MNLKQVNLVGWEENSGVALDGFQPTMLRGYLRVKPQSACVQQPQPHPLQPSSQLPQHHQLLDTPPPQLLPPTVTGPILVPRKYLVNICSGIHLLFLFWLTRLCFYISSWPSNATNQSDSEGWDAWPTSSSASQNPSLSVPSAQLRQRSAFTPAAMTTGSSPSPVLGQVGSKTALFFLWLSCSLQKNYRTVIFCLPGWESWGSTGSGLVSLEGKEGQPPQLQQKWSTSLLTYISIDQSLFI